MKRRGSKIRAVNAEVMPRQAHRITAGYDGASWSPNRAYINHQVQDADADLAPSVRRELVKNSRYLRCNSATYTGMIERLVTLIAGTGIMVSSASADTVWGALSTSNYSGWSRRCDIAYRSTRPTQQQTIIRSVIGDGEVFELMTEDVDENGEPRTQLLECHKIERIIANDYGRPLWYVRAGSKDHGKGKIPRDAIPADRIVHYFRPSRPGQTRGEPLFAAALNTARDVDELINIEKAASKAAAIPVEVLSTLNGEAPKGPMIGQSQRVASTTPSPNYRDMVGPEGKIIKAGESYQLITSQRPSQNWQGFIELLVQLLCLAGNLPPSVFMQIKVGGADTRRDLSTAQRVVEQWQMLLSDGEQRVWEYVIENTAAVEEGKPDDWRATSFQYPRKATVDDGRMGASDRADLACGAMSIEEFAGQYGGSGTALIAQIKAEMRAVNPALTDAQVDELLQLRLFGQATPTSNAKPAALPDSTSKPGADAQDSAAASGAVQSAALNGAQVTALVEIALKVATGELPRESAKAIAGAAFPLVSPAQLAAIFDKITKLEPTPQGAAPAS